MNRLIVAALDEFELSKFELSDCDSFFICSISSSALFLSLNILLSLGFGRVVWRRGLLGDCDFIIFSDILKTEWLNWELK